ncbi:DNA base-flipping protein [Pontiella desulfatans]|uniref:DNA base-flipping protein n=1 Tax=Pontiella desulfatans TaxID=2750659 RepID=A0A6C2UCB7_PONDE|nr:MGMT family protein [Pontiella desulfatans]VGO17014.1 DNA base-flipping protein [Pontiella desulfatans]
MQPFTEEIIEIIRSIPRGKVATYGGIAALAGNARAARQVVRVLHTFGSKEKLPWWRVISSKGTISLRPGHGYEEQRDLLEAEGVELGEAGRIDLERFLWEPDWLND